MSTFGRHPWAVLALTLVSLAARPSDLGAAGGNDPRALTVVSLNLAMREDVDQVFAELASVDDIRRADIILLQEVVRREGEPDVARQLGSRLGLDTEYRDAFPMGDGRMVGLALASRFPSEDVRVLPLPRFTLSFRSRTRLALVARISTPAGPIGVYNVHLDTRINRSQRLEQIETVARDAGDTGGPALVAGDFNTNNHHWLFHTIPLPFLGRQAAGVARFMEGHGFVSAFPRGRPTHDMFRMQLDWVFLRGLQAATTAIHPLSVSDHHALVVSVVPAD